MGKGWEKWDMICLGGATATGKSAVAVELARLLNGEIISVDSAQVYRQMDIGTDKPDTQTRELVLHHLIDVVEPWEEFNVARFVELARQAIEQVRSRGRLPILCGGTGLYFKALLFGLDPLPGKDQRLRQELESTPISILLEELRQADPVMYERIDRHNPRRIRRAIEILRLTGRPPSELRCRWTGPVPSPCPFFCLRRSRSDLRSRIASRVEEMFRRGLVEETRRLLEAGLKPNSQAAQLIGYRQVIEYLQGVRSLEETKELIIIRTYQLAKRQESWFRHQLDVEWINLKSDETPTQTAERIVERLTSWSEIDLTRASNDSAPMASH